MFGSDALSDELQTLKVDLSRLLAATADETLDRTKAQAEALAEQIKAALSELGETLSQDEAQLARIVSERPIASLASAFALGMVVGLLMRRH
jgi:ElaB/YqjD/DUF883 family membrane-anchored ribosome-binding protein